MKKSNVEVIRVNSIELKEGIYPRQHPDWRTSYAYSLQMKAGAIFPSIVVNTTDDISYELIDGWHRVQAFKTLKRDTIKALVYHNLSKKDAYVLAVKLNLQHGLALNTYDKVKIIKELKSMKVGTEEISRILCLEVENVKTLFINRTTQTTAGGTVVLKGGLKHFAGVTVPNDFEETQSHVGSGGQVVQLKQFIKMFDEGLWDTDDEKVVECVQELKLAIDGWFKKQK